MTESAVQAVHRRHFVETCGALMDWWIDVFPQCLIAKEKRVQLTGVVKGNVDRERAAVCEWHTNMSAPLHASVRYASALRRLGANADIYAACVYKDLPALLASGEEFETLQSLDLEASLEAKPDAKSQMWQFLSELNHAAQHYHDALQYTPTPAEIKENIRAHKQAKSASQKPMTRGWEAVYDELATHLDVADADRCDAASGMAMWTTGLREHDLAAVCERRDAIALAAIPFEHAPTRRAFAGALDDRAWQLLVQLCGLAGVTQVVPQNMMTRIEAQANRIASEIACGQTDLSKLNLADIGQSVLEGCDVSEVQQLGSQMSSLLPMLQSLQQNIPK